MAVGNRFFAQSAEMGALPTQSAATSPAVVGGAFYGPDGFAEQRGYPHRVSSTRASRDEVLARALWQRSLDLTGISFL